MFNNYRQYNISFIEVILHRLTQLFDVELTDNSFKYSKKIDFITKYLKYIVPGKKDISKLIELFELFDQDQFLLLALPINNFKLDVSTTESSQKNILDSLDSNIRKEIKYNNNNFIDNMVNHDSLNDFPLLFNNRNSLITFFEKKDEELEQYFIGNLLLFPIRMDWFLLFDYDLFAIHFCYNENVEKEKYFTKISELIHTKKDIQQLIKEANN